MNRIAIGKGGSWFDLDAASRWDEACEFDGRNMISRATGSQWDHELLFRTRQGTWIINQYSACQGSIETYEKVSEEEAARWVTGQGLEAPESLSSAVDSLEV